MVGGFVGGGWVIAQAVGVVGIGVEDMGRHHIIL